MSRPPRVHPRGRGEAAARASEDAKARGPSPRARGSPTGAPATKAFNGSIPAGAGKPRWRDTTGGSSEVHPRGRGEAPGAARGPSTPSGPSPRARGSLRIPATRGSTPGSIPAGAGKPSYERDSGRYTRVHPRGRGEADTSAKRRAVIRGPSPRARGSRVPAAGVPAAGGSIPAGAGKPARYRMLRDQRRVHPRGRGEAVVFDDDRQVIRGPSPRARGSRAPPRCARSRRGSIPAGAGKPSPSTLRATLTRVHPRGRGEATRRRHRGATLRGPSPRARGSLRPAPATRPAPGSIPAGAGKPGGRDAPGRLSRVHPRGRGEAARCRPAAGNRRGPSPRARGSRLLSADRRTARGSIPAGAGKPSYLLRSLVIHGVHPRGRGEATRLSDDRAGVPGPSPRARGSLRVLRGIDSESGSIPAGAGKPMRADGRPWRARVHPRGRGEASIQ